MDKISKGATAEIYAVSDDKILKLFFKGHNEVFARQEYEKHRFIQSQFQHMPAAYDFVEVNGRFGIIYDRIQGKDVTTILLTEPECAKPLSEALARIHADMHDSVLPANCLPDVKDKLMRDIRNASTLSAKQQNKIIADLAFLPDGLALCHFDFHSGNVLVNGSAFTVIDWLTACIGDPCADAARTYYMLRYAEGSDATPERQNKLQPLRDNISAQYLRCYLDCTGKHQSDVEKWITPIAAARLGEWTTEHEKQTLLNIVQHDYLRRT